MADSVDTTYFNDNSQIMDFSDSITGDMLNIYLDYIKKITNKPKNLKMFDGIDTNDPIATNMIIETFYSELMKYKEEDDEYIKVITYEELDENMSSNDELYCIHKNGDPFLVSRCLFSLLLEFREMKSMLGDKIKLEIVNLKD